MKGYIESSGLIARAGELSRAAVLLVSLVLLLGWTKPQAANADDFDKAPILYSSTKGNNAVTQLEKRLNSGTTKLLYDQKTGFLRSLLEKLKVPESSQMLVYSKTSMQRHRISPRTPRALYFNDDVYIGFCKNSDVLEISAVDPHLGAVFYTFEQNPQQKPTFVRQDNRCLLCHGSSQTNGVPGHVVRSVFPDSDGMPLLASGTYRINHTSPLEERWGGWYVTGTHGKQKHLGNLIFRGPHVSLPVKETEGLNVISLDKLVDLSGYPSKHSDIVALMVLEHQAEGHNLITKAAFETRMALHLERALNQELNKPADHRWQTTTVRIKAAADPLVEYFLFCNEAKLTGKITGATTFAEDFMKRGPRDASGRSLRDFDLEKRLFKYPCSYLIYSPSFDAIPAEAKDYIYERFWDILNGMDQSGDFDHLSQEDRRSILEILLATKQDLPAYWRAKQQS